MRLITLNTWGGRIKKELAEFLNKNSNSTDIFCFQEIYNRATHIHLAQGGIDPNLNLFDDLEKILTNHRGYFRPSYLETYGLATFVNKNISTIEEGEFFVHKNKGFMPGKIVAKHARNVQYISIRQNNDNLHVFNFHGLWNGLGKDDSEDRLEQSRKLKQYIQKFEGKKIICGDFNLSPDTESLKILERTPLRNLIKEYKVTSTRTSFYEKDNRFADYIFTNNKVNVVDFKVLKDEVSDHSPLVLNFN